MRCAASLGNSIMAGGAFSSLSTYLEGPSSGERRRGAAPQSPHASSATFSGFAERGTEQTENWEREIERRVQTLQFVTFSTGNRFAEKLFAYSQLRATRSVSIGCVWSLVFFKRHSGPNPSKSRCHFSAANFSNLLQRTFFALTLASRELSID